MKEKYPALYAALLKEKDAKKTFLAAESAGKGAA